MCMWSKKSKMCRLCRNTNRVTFCENSTIGEKTYYKYNSAKYSYIRRHASRIMSDVHDKSCKNCKYSKHVEIAHIKSISSFSKDTIIKDVNKIENLIFLCPNCHWEFDHGDLTIKQILK